MKLVVQDLHAHGWLIAPSQLHVLTTDYQFTTIPAMKAGLDKFWTLKSVDLPWKPQTVFVPLSRQLLDDKRVPGVGDVVELTGHFEAVWLRKDRMQTESVSKQVDHCLHTIQTRLNQFTLRFDRTYPDWHNHLSWFKRSSHIDALADVAGLISTIKRISTQVGPKIQRRLSELWYWLRQQLLDLQQWLDAQLTRVYCFIQATRPNARFILQTPPVPKELAFHRSAVDQRSVDSHEYRVRWLHNIEQQAQHRLENRIPLLQSQMVDAYHWHEALDETYEQLGVLDKLPGL